MRNIHFIAIGGKAMHNLAIALSQKGYQISGSDDEIYDPSHSRLKQAGLLPEKMGWDEERITDDIDAIILGMHARADNPELKKATELGLRIYSYPEFLYEVSKDKTRIVVAGSHGKTTTTAMVMQVLKHEKVAHDYMVGAQIEDYDNMVSLTDAGIIVLEGDEYLSSPIDRRPKFLHYRPDVTIITGIAWDHINVFPTFQSYLDQFRLLIESVEPSGKVIYYEEDKHLSQLIDNCERKDIQFISYNTIQLNGSNQALLEGKWIEFPIIGHHNYQNMEACRLCCSLLGIENGNFIDAMKSFKGVSRRLQVIHQDGDKTVFLDYAHAPSKVKATTEAVRTWYPNSRLIAIYELHTFSSLNKSFLPEYRGSLEMADVAIVYYDHHTIQMKRMEDLEEGLIKSSFARSDLEVYSSSLLLKNRIKEMSREGGIFLLMSSGTFSHINVNSFF